MSATIGASALEHHQSHERLCAHRRPRDHNALRLVWHAKLGRQQRSGLADAAGEGILVRLHAKLRTRKALILAGRTLPLSSEAEHTFQSNRQDQLSGCRPLASERANPHGQHLNANLLQHLPNGAINGPAIGVQMVSRKVVS
jgi:hypothetical protein